MNRHNWEVMLFRNGCWGAFAYSNPRVWIIPMVHLKFPQQFGWWNSRLCCVGRKYILRQLEFFNITKYALRLTNPLENGYKCIEFSSQTLNIVQQQKILIFELFVEILLRCQPAILVVSLTISIIPRYCWTTPAVAWWLEHWTCNPPWVKNLIKVIGDDRKSIWS